MNPNPLPPLERDLLRFGEFELNVRTGELWRGRTPVPLRPLAGRALIALAEKAGHLVSRDELQQTLWPDAVVAWDQSLNQCIRQVRRALGDDAAKPAFVETVPRRGYRFRATVTRHRGALALAVRPAGVTRTRRPFAVPFLAGAATALAVPLILFVVCAVLAALEMPAG